MAIITKPAITKGNPAIFTLNKVELEAHPLVSGNGYFSNSTRWKKVDVLYTSNPGNQTKTLEFDVTGTNLTPTASILLSLKARNVFQVVKVSIIDEDGGVLQIPRQFLIASDFDFTIFDSFGYDPVTGFDKVPATGAAYSFSMNQYQHGSALIPIGGSLSVDNVATYDVTYMIKVLNWGGILPDGSEFGDVTIGLFDTFVDASSNSVDISLRPSGITLRRSSGVGSKSQFFYLDNILPSGSDITIRMVQENTNEFKVYLNNSVTPYVLVMDTVSEGISNLYPGIFNFSGTIRLVNSYSNTPS